jgi:hypothetical protein
MTTDAGARRGARPARHDGSARGWKAAIVAGLAAAYVAAFYFVADPLGRRAAKATEPAPRKENVGATRPVSVTKSAPRPTKVSRASRPARIRTRSS